MNFKEAIKAFFVFNPSDQKALIIVIIICLFVAVSPAIYEHYFIKEEIFVPSEDFLSYQEYIKNSKWDNQKSIYSKNEKSRKNIEPILKKFNPNLISKKEWQDLGVNDFAVKNVLSYLEKGGRFQTKKDLKKIYGIEKNLDRIYPYIDLPENISKPSILYKREDKKLKTDPLVQLSKFNPNKLSKEKWKQLGLNSFAANNAISYTEKGGAFKYKTDLKKIYGLTESDYKRLEAYIDLPIKDHNEIKQNETEVSSHFIDTLNNIIAKDRKNEIVAIDINNASAEEFKQIYGIGNILSERIIEFRNKLGGFVSVSQINEIYGIDDELFHSISDQLNLGKTTIRKININKATEDELSSHSYISRKLAKHIIKFRASKGSFKNVNELRESYLIDEELYLKIKPYLEAK